MTILSYQPDPNHHDPNTLLGRIRFVLWRSWDPLETSGTTGAPDDEYDMYGTAIMKLLEDGSSVEAIASHLSRIQMEQMDCPDTPERNGRIAEKLISCRVRP